jgi:hydroxypyruvate reductase
MHQALRSVPRQTVDYIFRAGLAAAHGDGCVATWLQDHPLSGPIYLVAIGKAACTMSMGANRILHEQIIQGLVITKAGHLDAVLVQDIRFRCIESGHPLPNSDSLLAGNELCRFLEDAPLDAEFLFLISGGASSLVEVLRDGINLDDLLLANRWLLGSGLDIAAINRVRQALSRLKGGGLLAFLNDRKATVLLVSDVAGDDPAIIGSGLLMPGNTLLDEKVDLPGWLVSMLAGPGQPAQVPENVRHHIVATIDTALEAATSYSRESGLPVTIMNNRLAGDASLAGADIAACLKEVPAGVYLWGGETTVKLPESAGAGGRNQHLALVVAMALSQQEDIVVLAAGTDGTDGPARYAGAIVDSTSITRGQARGLDPLKCLQQADAGSFLAASGDLLETGPTGTNVMDMVVGYKNVSL